MKVLVAGATGNLGKPMVRAFKERGYWVRALARNAAKLEDIQGSIDDVFLGDATRNDTLSGLCDDIDIVFSALGRTLSLRTTKEKGGFRSVDYIGNNNLLEVAKKASIKKFLYVSVFGPHLFPDLEYVKAHEDFVTELRASGLDYAVIRPTAFFSTLGETLRLARSGRAFVIGDGQKRINAIHELDLAEVCVAAVTNQQHEIPVGGPIIYTRAEIAQLGFNALKRPGKIHSHTAVVC